MNAPSIDEMFKAGVHLGHKKAYTHPKSKQYTFAIRNKIYIIDLEKTQELLEKASDFLKNEIQAGKTVLFVGTKPQAREIVKEAAQKCKMPYVVDRWYGGTLTNFETILKNLKHLEDLERKISSEEFTSLIKKERLQMEKEKNKLLLTLEGIRPLKKLPDVLLIVGAAKEAVAVKEARIFGIPIVAICDTDTDASLIDWPIPANDDAKKSIGLLVNFIVEFILGGSRKTKTN